MKPLDDSLESAAGLAKKYQVDGVVYLSLKFCACYGVSKLAFIEVLQDRRPEGTRPALSQAQEVHPMNEVLVLDRSRGRRRAAVASPGLQALQARRNRTPMPPSNARQRPGAPRSGAAGAGNPR